jgi:hypothetical protein
VDRAVPDRVVDSEAGTGVEVVVAVAEAITGEASHSQITYENLIILYLAKQNKMPSGKSVLWRFFL